MEFELSKHATESLLERQIQLKWIAKTFSQPQKVESDRLDINLEHRLLRIEEFDGRFLRVIINKSLTPPRIVTAYFDRGMKNRL